MLDTITTISDGIRLSVRGLPNFSRKNQDYQQQEGGKQNSSFSQLAKKKNKAIRDILTLGFAELIGTALLLFLGCMGCVTTPESIPVPHHLGGIIFGFVVLLIIQLFGHISGAHLNPAVTFSAAIQGQLRPVLIPIYVVAQFIGALLGFAMLKVLLPPEFTSKAFFNPETNETEYKYGICGTTVHPKVSTIQGLTIEVIITTVLIMVCCAVWDKRNAANTDSTAVRFGLVISVISMVAGPFTGASMNTVRSFAPALFNNDWNSHWIYWVGPNLGSLVGTFCYKFIFEKSPEDPNEDQLNNTEDIPLHENHMGLKNNIV